ncbi:MAG: RidA family protein [Gammaproteobacteria bacterium]|jgi:enamine deaminase RidA (YjgF/YER057c/UK114 family)|nr:RidA family protein [Gammaproteobacteria bacterium]MDA7723228.1 Rid family hydrolase [Pseudomonadales bacterium]MDB2596354.1 Rid family hydrolase [Pseudomonadales bacterium]MDB2645573.1 Rid family hydrolase [Pseudomonadales bacterium]MDC3409585.1 Rid family hydrolase [bacterium]
MTISKKSFRSGPYAALIAQAVQVDNVLYLSGQVGMGEDGNAPSDITEQTILAYNNIKTVLAEFGANMSNIVDETFYVTDVQEVMANVEKVFAARESAYGEQPEVSQTLIGVTALVDPTLKIEIKCVAHL